MAPRGKVVRSTAEQINRLVDYMSTNRLFACNEFSGPHGTQRMEAEWVRLKSMLAAFGPDKSVDQWKHTWRDLRKKAREEAIRARMAHNRTGDAGSIPELTENNKKILFTIGQKRANRFCGEQENGIEVGPIDAETTPAPPQVSTEGYTAHDFEYMPVEAEVQILEPPAAPEPPRRPRPRPRPRPRLRPAAAPAPAAPIHSAALLRAQIRTNRILQDIAVELRTAARHRKRERMKGGVYSLKF